MKKTGIVLLVGCVFGSAGCAPRALKVEAPAAPRELSLTERLMVDNDRQIKTELEEILAVQAGTKPPPPGAASSAGDRFSLINFNGDVKDAVKVLAARRGYAFRVSGRYPGVPVTIGVDIRNETFARAAFLVGQACGGRADVILSDAQKVLELRYSGL